MGGTLGEQAGGAADFEGIMLLRITNGCLNWRVPKFKVADFPVGSRDFYLCFEARLNERAQLIPQACYFCYKVKA